MSYKIIVDSCGELFDDMKADGRFQSVPLELEVDGYHVVDDESFDQLEFIRRVRKAGIARSHPAHLHRDMWKHI